MDRLSQDTSDHRGTGPTRGKAAYSNSRRPPRVRAAALWRRRGRNGSFASSQLELGSGGKDGVVEQT